MTDNTNSRDTLWGLIRDIKTAMLTTVHENGRLHARPVMTQNRGIDNDDLLWFFISRSGDAAAEVASHPQVGLAYAHPGRDCYVSISGSALIVDNPQKKEALWSRLAGAYFAGGVNDPDLALLCVRISHAHYWDVKENKLTQLYEMTRAAVTGTRPNLGSDTEVSLHH